MLLSFLTRQEKVVPGTHSCKSRAKHFGRNEAATGRGKGEEEGEVGELKMIALSVLSMVNDTLDGNFANLSSVIARGEGVECT